MSKIAISLLTIYIIISSACTNDGGNKLFSQQEKVEPRQLNNNTSVNLRLDSVVLDKELDLLRFYGSVENHKNRILYLPVSKEFPIVSNSAIDSGIKSFEVLGLTVVWHAGAKTVTPPDAPPIAPGFTDFDPFSVQSFEDSVMNLQWISIWQRRNLVELENLRKKEEPFKRSYNWYFRHKQMVSDSPFIIQSKGKRNIVFDLNLKERTQNFHNKFQYELDDFIKNIDSVELKIISDTVMLKDSILLKSDLVKFKKKGIHIFDGVVKSNKAKLIKK